MDRRSFLTALFGIAGAAALASTVRPVNAMGVFQAPAFSMNLRRLRPRPLTKMHRQKCSRSTIGTGIAADTIAGAAGDGSAVATGDMAGVASGAIADGVLRSSCDSS